MTNDELQRIRSILKEAQADCDRARLHANAARSAALDAVAIKAATQASVASDAAWSAWCACERLTILLRDIK